MIANSYYFCPKTRRGESKHRQNVVICVANFLQSGGSAPNPTGRLKPPDHLTIKYIVKGDLLLSKISDFDTTS